MEGIPLTKHACYVVHDLIWGEAFQTAQHRKWLVTNLGTVNCDDGGLVEASFLVSRGRQKIKQAD